MDIETKYIIWINQYKVKRINPFGFCNEAVTLMQKEFPELIIQTGEIEIPKGAIMGMKYNKKSLKCASKTLWIPHTWLSIGDTIIDPTAYGFNRIIRYKLGRYNVAQTQLPKYEKSSDNL